MLGSLLSMAGAQPSIETSQPRAAPTPARMALEQMSPAARKNSSISVEFESSDNEAVLLGHEVEQLWNGGEYDEALAQLGRLEVRVGHVAVGNSWRRPVPTLETSLWGRDVRIGSRDSLLEVSFDFDPSSANLFVALRRAIPPHFSVCMSTDSGATWSETFTWSGSAPTSLDAAVLGNHLYVVYNSPEENAQQVRLRRLLCSNGKGDTFGIGGYWVAPCTLDAGDTMREVSIVSNPNNVRLYVVSLISDGSVTVSSDDANAVSWTRQATGITSGARNGLDATDDGWSDRTMVFISYCDTSDTMRVYDEDGQRLAQPAGTGSPTSIAAYLDTVICLYEDETSSPHRVRCAGSFDGGDTWALSTLSDSGVAADAPAVTMKGGHTFAAVYRRLSTAPELLFCERVDSGPWSDPVSIAENAPSGSRPGIVCLAQGVYGVAYLADTSPVVRGAYFDRSDWVYGIEETMNDERVTMNARATIVRGVLMLGALDGRQNAAYGAELLDVSGRKVLGLRAGANDVSRLAPGVYFVHSTLGNRQSTMTKVVVAR